MHQESALMSVWLFSILKKMEKEEIKEAVMEFDNIVFVYHFEDLDLWHTWNFQKDLTVTKGNRVQMSNTQITEPVYSCWEIRVKEVCYIYVLLE